MKTGENHNFRKMNGKIAGTGLYMFNDPTSGSTLLQIANINTNVEPGQLHSW